MNVEMVQPEESVVAGGSGHGLLAAARGGPNTAAHGDGLAGDGGATGG